MYARLISDNDDEQGLAQPTRREALQASGSAGNPSSPQLPTDDVGPNPKAPYLRGFTICTGLVHLGSGVATLILRQDKKVPLFEPWLAWPSAAERSDPLTNKFITGNKYAGSISFEGLVASFFFLSATFQVLPALWDVSWHWLINLLFERNVQPIRWVEYSASASVMFLMFFLLNGGQNLPLLICVFALSFVMMILGLVSEASAYFQRTIEYLSNGKQKRQPLDYFLPHILGWVPFGILWGLIFRAFVLGTNHGRPGVSNDYAKPPWWVYAVFSGQVGLMALFGANQLWQQYSLYTVNVADFTKQARIALRTEYIYVALSLTAKSMLAWVLYFGMRSQGDTAY